eukprot:159508_1
MAEQQQWGCIEPSVSAMDTKNPIRLIVDRVSSLKPTSNKSIISLVAGDPAKYDNLSPPPSIKEAFKILYNNSSDKEINKYPSYTIGLPSTRQAILDKYIVDIPNIDINDIFACCGCTQSLSLCFCSLLNANSNDNILLPCPGWSAYKTICIKNNFKYKYYNCVANDNWEIDCTHLETIIDNNTKAILINNPSNPCANILSEDNLLKILQIANKYKLVIISDEIYSLLVYPNYKYISFSSLKNKYSKYKNVPIFICSGTAKSHLIPGWKFGWIVIDDRSRNKFTSSKLRVAITRIKGIQFGPPSVIQTIMPYILSNTKESFFDRVRNKLYSQTLLFCKYINDNIPQLYITNMPQATLYVFIKINIDEFDDTINNDMDFFEKLLSEQLLVITPGSLFGINNYFRAVICPPNDVLLEAAKRLKQFCDDHKTKRMNSKL